MVGDDDGFVTVQANHGMNNRGAAPTPSFPKTYIMNGGLPYVRIKGIITSERYDSNLFFQSKTNVEGVAIFEVTLVVHPWVVIQ